MSLLFAQISSGSANAALNAGETISQAIADSFDRLWEQVLGGQLYAIINNVGLFFALISIGFWCVMLYKALDQNDMRPGFSELIFPIVVIFLLANGGQNLASATLGMRSMVNGINQQVIETVGASVDFQRTLNNLASYSSAKSQVSQLANQCNGITKNEELQACLQDAQAQAQTLISQYSGGNPPAAWIQDIQNSAQGIADKFSIFSDGAGGGFSGAVAGGLGVLGDFSTAPFLIAAEAIIVATQGAFQYGIEVSMLMTALLGPIAVGLSFLPMGAKPIYAWLTGFWSLGICKLSLNIITGLVATAVQEAGPASSDTLVTAIAIGILSPLLSLGLAAGGGKAIFDGILSAATAASASGFNVGVSLTSARTIQRRIQ